MGWLRLGSRDAGRIIRRMRPREQTISVGGIDVHAWTGGQGEPLMVFHGAGGNRGWTRWVEQVAQRFTVWAPPIPDSDGRATRRGWKASTISRASISGSSTPPASAGHTCSDTPSAGGWLPLLAPVHPHPATLAPPSPP